MKYLIILFFITSSLSVSLFGQNVDSLKASLHAVKGPNPKTQLYLSICEYYFMRNNYDSMKMYADSAFDIATRYHIKNQIAAAVMGKGIYHFMRSEFDKSLEYFNQIPNISDSTKLIAWSLISASNVYTRIGDFEKSIETNLDLLSRIENKKGFDGEIAGCYNSLGDSYTALNQFKMALKYRKLMLETSRKTGDPRFIRAALSNLCSNYKDLGEYEKAISFCEESLKLNDDGHDLYAKGSNLLNMGMSFLKIGKKEKALKILEEAIIIAEQTKIHELIMKCHLGLAEVYAALGDFEKSYKEQALYSELKEKHLREGQKAIKSDMTSEIAKKEVELEKRNLSISRLSSHNLMIVFSGLGMIIIGATLLIYYRSKKRKSEFERERLAEQKSILNRENLQLKSRLNELALTIESSTKESDPDNGNKYKNSSLTKEKRMEYMQAILNYMEQEKPYLNFDIAQNDLANAISISSHHLSEVLSVCFEKNFYHFINIYRVDAAKRLLKINDHSKLKILAVGMESGFKSKTTFNRVFKDLVGLTPTEYREKFMVSKSKGY